MVVDLDGNVVSSKKEEMSTDEQSRIMALSIRVELLFGFCAELTPDIDLLEKAATGAAERESYSMSAAPILGAMGIDFQEKSEEWARKKQRALALINLLKVLNETEKERKESERKKANIASAEKTLSRYLGE